MPLYEVQHYITLTISQKDELAEAITKIHSTKFSTPRMFVNVHFTSTSTLRSYVGGRPRQGNHIRATVRNGPSRTSEDWNDLTRQLQQAWTTIVGPGLPKVRRSDTEEADTSLRSIILCGEILGGMEAGFFLPPAGGDKGWIERNWEAFRERADRGEEEFRDLVREVEERGLLGDGEGKEKREEMEMKREQARLEEMMGWGEHA
ncbi:hypothetical protein KC318_g8331 [Hortaea werneckii]|nr:hypothetical protein KC334_g8480 [Hortaea werneckii]KAI7005115.1 hypothetical protein KC355_g8363 [Hortaea werneckii]KAI7663390.1 hypothetical protein KC318_g8331 [Hortaea werneckii]